MLCNYTFANRCMVLIQILYINKQGIVPMVPNEKFFHVNKTLHMDTTCLVRLNSLLTVSQPKYIPTIRTHLTILSHRTSLDSIGTLI